MTDPPRARRRLVTVDLDSTLCDTRHRASRLPEDRAEIDWEAYSMLCADDAPIAGTVALVRALSMTHDIAYVSARNECAREVTELWLKRYVGVQHVALLLLEEGGDHSTHGGYKVRRIRELTDAGHRVAFHIDDWPEVAEELREIGVPGVTLWPLHVLMHGSTAEVTHPAV